MAKLSPPEYAFICQGIVQDIRLDGRGRFEYRYIEAEQSVLPLAHGSARVVLAGGATEVLASVKLELGVPSASAPDRGRIAVSVDYPTRFFARSSSKMRLDDVAEITRTLESLFTTSDSIDFRALCIVPGQHCWVVYIDLLVLESGGSLLDTLALAVYAALQDTRLPRLQLIAAAGSDGSATPGAVEIEVDEDPAAFDAFPVAGVPVCVTFLQVAECSIVDACESEEACADARVRVAVNRSGEVCAVLVDGDSHLDPRRVQEAVEAARSLAPALYARADSAMQQQQQAHASSGGALQTGASRSGVSQWLSSVGTAIITADQAVAVPSEG